MNFSNLTFERVCILENPGSNGQNNGFLYLDLFLMDFHCEGLRLLDNQVNGNLMFLGNPLGFINISLTNVEIFRNSFAYFGFVINNVFIFLAEHVDATHNNHEDLLTNFVSAASLFYLNGFHTVFLTNLSVIASRSNSHAPVFSSIRPYGYQEDEIFWGLEGARFVDNGGFFNDFASEAALFFEFESVATHVSLKNATFQRNQLFSNLTETAVSAVLMIHGSQASVLIEFCEFLENISSDISSVLYFVAVEFVMRFCYFADNGFSDESNFFGTLYLSAGNFTVEDTIFVNNSGVDGTCFKISEEQTSVKDVYSLKRLLIIRNSASYQATFLSRDNFQANEIGIESSYFLSNYAVQYSGCFYFGTLYNAPQVDVFVRSSIFDENWSDLSGGVIYCSFSGDAIAIYFIDCILLSNNLYNLDSIYPQGGVADIWGYANSSLIFYNCLSFNNFASNGGFLSMVVGVVIDENSTYIENFAQMLGGNFFLSSDVVSQFKSTRFLNTYATLGGGLFVHHGSTVSMEDCEFDAVHAQRGGVFMFDLASSFTFSGLKVQKVFGDLGSLLYLTNSNGAISEFQASEVHDSGSTISLIYCEQAQLLLKDNWFYNMTATIFHFHSSEIELRASLVENLSCVENGEGCVVNLFRTPSVFIEGLRVVNMSRGNTYDGGVVYSMESCVQMRNISLESLQSSKENSYGTIIMAASSMVFLEDTRARNFMKGGLYLKESFLFIANSSFVNEKPEEFIMFQDVIYCENCYFLMLMHTVFQNFSFFEGQPNSVVFIQQSTSLQESQDTDTFFYLLGGRAISLNLTDFPDYFFVIDCEFADNHAKQASVLQLYAMSYLLLENSVFLRNSAEDFAGCLYFSFTISENSDDCSEILLRNNIFRDNSAANEGGAIKWFANLSPSLENNTFFNNSAIYGNEIASIPVRLWFKVFEKANENEDYETGTVIYDSLVNNTGFSLDNIMSGDTLNFYFELYLVDNLNQSILEANTRGEATLIDGAEFLSKNNISQGNFSEKCSNDSLSRFNFSCNSWLLQKILAFSPLQDESYHKSNKTSLSLDLTLQKNSSDARIFNKADRIVLTNTPTRFAFLLFDSNMVSSTYFSLLSSVLPNEIRESSSNSYQLIIPVYFRACLPGEIYDNETNTCIVCAKTRYSFNPFSNSCKLCPANAECLGGMQVSLREGYWRSDIFSDKIYKCEVPLKSCLGGYESKCKNLYGGRICDDCVGETLENQKNIYGFCDECFSAVGTFFIFLLIAFLEATILIVYINKILIFSKKKGQEIFIKACLIKIALNFLQTCYLLPIDNVNMPEYMLYYYKFVVFAFDLLQKWITTGCFHFAFPLVGSKFHSSLVIYCLTLVIFIVTFVVFWRLKYKKIYKENFKVFMEKARKGIIFIFFYFQPSILTLAFRNFHCVSFDEKKYVKFDIKQECWTEEYVAWTVCLNSLVIFLFLIVFPLISYRKYYKYSKKKLSAEEFKKIIEGHFFFLGYKKKFAYWEIFIFFRKILLITYVSLVDADGNSIALAILMLNISQLLQLYFKPFKYEILNKFENYAYFAVTLNYYILLFFYIEESNEQMNQLLFAISLLSMILFFLIAVQYYFGIKLDRFLIILKKIFRRSTKTRSGNIKVNDFATIMAKQKEKNK